MSGELLNNYHLDGKKLIKSTSKDVIEALGEEGIRSLVLNVLCGGNVRDITEFMTRNRIIVSNAALFKLVTELQDISSDEEYILKLNEELQTASNDSQRLLPLWLLGLTKKGLDNIVRGRENINDYSEKLEKTFEEITPMLEKNFGKIEGKLIYQDKEIELNWEFFNRLFTGIGSQTLTVRGSSKSMSGKLFERLILGTALSILGFNYIDKAPEIIMPDQKLFWLSSSTEEEREIDGTVVHNKKAVRIDIGFIGKGNPEIATDKMTRFRSESEIGKVMHGTQTIVIVDTIGNNSHMGSIAKGISGFAIEMKSKVWLQDLAEALSQALGVQNVIEKLSEEELHQWIEKKIVTLSLEDFIQKIDSDT